MSTKALTLIAATASEVQKKSSSEVIAWIITIVAIVVLLLFILWSLYGKQKTDTTVTVKKEPEAKHKPKPEVEVEIEDEVEVEEKKVSVKNKVELPAKKKDEPKKKVVASLNFRYDFPVNSWVKIEGDEKEYKFISFDPRENSRMIIASNDDELSLASVYNFDVVQGSNYLAFKYDSLIFELLSDSNEGKFSSLRVYTEDGIFLKAATLHDDELSSNMDETFSLAKGTSFSGGYTYAGNYEKSILLMNSEGKVEVIEYKDINLKSAEGDIVKFFDNMGIISYVKGVLSLYDEEGKLLMY